MTMGVTSIVLLALLAQASSPAADAQDREKARGLLKEGTALYRKHDYASALGKYEAAYATYPSPKLWFNIGQANRDLGRPVEALAAFEKFLALAIDASPDNSEEARSSATELQKKLGQLRIECQTAGAEISVDGKSIGRAPLPNPVWATPGRHQVSAVQEGTAPAIESVVVAAGTAENVVIRLVSNPPPPPAPEPAPSPTTAQKAQEHHRKATLLFDAGNYREAIVEFEEAYVLTEDPEFLFNIGQAHRLRGDSKSALRAYKRYLQHRPEADNRPEVERLISSLEEPTAPSRSSVSKTSSPPPPARNIRAREPPSESTASQGGSWSLSTGAVVTMLAGAASIGIGVYLSIETRRIQNELSTSSTFSAAKDDEGKSYHSWQYYAYGLGGAFLALGLAECFWANSKPSVSVLPSVAPHYAGGNLTTRF
jgi:tetratricopeptide (TPR) repeat protein